MLEVLIFDVIVHLRSREGLISGGEYYFVYLTLEFRSLFMTVIRREIKGLINDLKLSRRKRV